MTNYIWVTAEKDMLHRYPNAPREVSFLKNEHRHNFKFKIYIEIFNNNRDIEFIIFQRFIKGILFKMAKEVNTNSCEDIANYIHSFIVEKYPNRKIGIEVSEDGENGVFMDYSQSQHLNSDAVLK